MVENTEDSLEHKINLGNADDDEIYNGKSYKITTTANDFNVFTIASYFDKGTFEIPPFQRNYVWDIKKASKLIESLIIGLPIPQVFLYRKERNKLAIIDGQQRLTSIYYFLKGRFPKPEKVAELRRIMSGKTSISEDLLNQDAFFKDFKLTFTKDYDSSLQGLKYANLDEDTKNALDLTPLRSITITQEDPSNHESMYEIFNRLNTGGINLKPQEIRMSLNHSNFFDMLWDLNENATWRELIGSTNYDKHALDIEMLTRAYAMLLYYENYSANSMIQFLNKFSENMKKLESENKINIQYYEYLKLLFINFIEHCKSLNSKDFTENGKFVFPLFEACFHASCLNAVKEASLNVTKFSSAQINQILNNPDFKQSREQATNNTTNVATRLRVAREIIYA